MIEIPDDAMFMVQGKGRVDIWLLPGQVVEFSGLEVTGAMVFRKVDRRWAVFVVGGAGAWESFRVGEQDAPDVVKDMV